VKTLGKYRRKESWKVKRYENYGRNPTSIVIRLSKYRRKLWNHMENIVEWQVD
jgi:hypothetical protein